MYSAFIDRNDLPSIDEEAGKCWILQEEPTHILLHYLEDNGCDESVFWLERNKITTLKRLGDLSIEDLLLSSNPMVQAFGERCSKESPCLS